MAGWIALVLLILAAFAIVLRDNAGNLLGYTPAEMAGIAFGLALLIGIALPLLGRYRGRSRTALRDVLLWLGVAAGAGLLYSYRAELPGITNDLITMVAPPGSALTVPAPVETERMVRLRRQPGGRFTAHATINGEAVDVVIDTGATTVVLRSPDAQQIGIDTENLTYNVPVQTANGPALAAPVKLQSVLVGPVGLSNVEALVMPPSKLDRSLLGMSFLSRLKAYEFSGDFLSLRG